MADRIIFISAKKISGKTYLHLRDSNGNSGIDTLTTRVQPGDSIFWIIDNDVAVSEFSIERPENKDCMDIFNADPFRISTSEWVAVVRGNIESGIYTYDVSYTLNDEQCKTDPVIIVEPPK